MLFTKFITKSLFDTLNEQFPQSISDKSFRNFLMYLIFGSWQDFETKHLRLNQSICAILEEKPFNGHYVAKTYLDRITTYLPDIKINGWSHNGFQMEENLLEEEYVENRGRLLIDSGLSQEFKTQIIKEKNILLVAKREDLVHYFTGSKWNRVRHKAQIEQEEIADVKRISATNVIQLQQQFLDYFNGLDTNSFNKTVTANLDAAIEMAQTFPFVNEEVRQFNLNTLSSIKIQPKPFYFAVEKSRRLYGMGSSILSLKREIRKCLTKGWIEFDLSNCHLAIIAKDWNIPELSKLLETSSIWNYLINHLPEKDFLEKGKPLIKKVIYGMVYGQSKTHMKQILRDGGFTQKQADYFFNDIPMIKTIFEARQRELEGCLFMPKDCFGQEIKFNMPQDRTVTGKNGKSFTIKDLAPARSVLAQKAQAVELKMLEPLIEYSRTNSYNMLVCLYQFDGFSVICKQPSRITNHCNVLKKLLDEHIKEMGYNTSVEYKINQ